MEGQHSDLPEETGQPDLGLLVMDTVEQPRTAYASSVSLSSPDKSEPDSDFAGDGAGTDAGLSRPASSDEEASDSTYGTAQRCSYLFSNICSYTILEHRLSAQSC